MTNHVHVTLEDVRGELSRTLHFLNSVYARRFNHRHGRTGHVFERRFWSSLIETDSYLTTVVEYVHRNPLEAGIVGRPADYRWSSYASYLGMRRPPSFLHLGLVLGMYGNDRELLRISTERVRRNDRVDVVLGARNPPPIVGSKAFVERMMVDVTASATTESSRRKVVADGPPWSLDDITEAVCDAACLDRIQLVRSTQGRSNPARSAAIYVAHRLGGHRLGDVAAAFGCGSPSSVSMASQRFHCRVQTDSSARTLLDAVLGRLEQKV